MPFSICHVASRSCHKTIDEHSPLPPPPLSLLNEDISACVHSAQVIFANFVRFVCRRHTKKQFAVHFNWSLVRGNLLSSTDTDIDTAREGDIDGGGREVDTLGWQPAKGDRQAGKCQRCWKSLKVCHICRQNIFNMQKSLIWRSKLPPFTSPPLHLNCCYVMHVCVCVFGVCVICLHNACLDQKLNCAFFDMAYTWYTFWHFMRGIRSQLLPLACLFFTA